MALFKSILIGIGAGLAAALFFAGSDSLFGIALVALAPLPITIATLSFGPVAAIAALLAGAARMAAMDPRFALIFLAVIALPAAGLSTLAALAKPLAGPLEAQTGKPGQEWYPLDRLLILTGMTAVGAILLSALIAGYSQDQLLHEITQAFTPSPDLPSLTPEQIERGVRLYLAWMPFLMTAGLTGMLVFALWAGGRIAKLSDQLVRPWTPIWSVRLQAWVSYLFLASAAASFVGGPIGSIAAAVAGAASTVLALAGWAAIHALTLGRPWRVRALVGAYVLALFGGGIPLPAIIGMADSLFDFRSRMGGKAST